MFQFLIDEEENQKESISASSTSLESLNREAETVDFNVGDRIRSDKYCGVIKYIGVVNPYSGIWLGIEWDDSLRGKHSGTVDGIEYFQSAQTNAASFIRPHKTMKLKTIFEGLEDRYGYDEKVMSKLKLLDEAITPRRVNYDQLTVLDLADQNIFDLGAQGELTKLCSKVEFLNLGENFIKDWEVLSSVCQPFQNLKGLDVSGNPLRPLCAAFQGKNHKVPFPNLEHVVLGNVKYSWNDVLSTSVLWPQLTNLQVPFNVITSLTVPTTSLLNLTSLDLESNQISDWDEVIKLNVCQNLEYLNICGNKIKSVRFPVNHDDPKNCQIARYFQNLKRLNISINAIEDWISITELSKVQQLTELRIELNPVFGKDTKENNRQMVIARMAKLTKLEGVEITRQERRDAEIDYTKKFSEKWRSEGTELRFAVEHPRYTELITKFGEPDGSELVKAPKSFQSSLITLEFIPESVNTELKSCCRKIMPNMTVQKLKTFVQRLFKTSVPISYLEVISSQNSGITFPLDNDHFDLSQYSVEDGDKVIVRWRN